MTVNGKATEVPAGASVADLIVSLGLGARWVVVERNGEPVNRRDHDSIGLEPGDRIEIVRAVAGG